MIVLTVRTPYCFKMKDIEVHVGFELLYQFDREFALIVCEGTEFSIVTFLVRTIEVAGAKLGFVFIRMIEFLNTVVRFIAIIAIRTLLVTIHIIAFFGLIKAKIPTSIFFVIMIEGALLEIVTLWITSARLGFKKIQIQEWYALAHAHILRAVITVLFKDFVRQIGLLIGYDASSANSRIPSNIIIIMLRFVVRT
jgi:hypothetical protein